MKLAVILAMVLVVLQVGPLVGSINHFVAHNLRAESIMQIATLIQKPAVLFGGACTLTLLGIAAIPLLRRWV